MDKAVANVSERMKGIRTGRASPGLVEGLRADYYGSPTPLKQIANISAPEPRLLVITPFDPGSLKAIEMAIQKSDLGINPSSDGQRIRLQVPTLSQEQRQRLASQVKEFAEEGKVAIRNIRRDANKQGETAKKQGDLTEDDLARLQKEIQDLTRDHEQAVDDLLARKTEEVME
jgi:ribosome recycling factor